MSATSIEPGPISPELVLVDDELRERARARLPLPPDVLARPAPSEPARPEVAVPAGARPRPERTRADAAETELRPSAEPVEDLLPKHRRRPRFFTVAVVTAFGALGIGGGYELAGVVSRSGRAEPPIAAPSAGASQSSRNAPSTGAVPATTARLDAHATQTQAGHASGSATAPAKTPRRHRTAALPSRRLAWAPVPRAGSYEIEIFRGRALIFRTTSKTAAVVLPSSWTLRGRRQTLRPGTYSWYVWPVVRGRRSRGATVRAKLVLSR